MRSIPVRVLCVLVFMAVLMGGKPARAENVRCLGFGVPNPIPAGEVIVGYTYTPSCPLLPQPLYNAAITSAPAENLQICTRFLTGYYFIPSGWMTVPEFVTSSRCNFGTSDTTSNNAFVLRLLSGIPGLGVTDSARYQAVITPSGLASAFGSGLTAVSQSGSCSLTLGRVHVWVLDGQSIFRQACILFAGPTQINFQVPSTAASAVNTTGRVLVYNLDQARIVAQGAVPLRPTAPALFTQNQQGTGRAAANLLRVRAADGSQVYEDINNPIDVNTPDDLYLVLYGTGIRNVPSVSQVRTSISGIFNQVTFAGAQGSVGLDQVNVLLDKAALAGLHGEQSVVVSVTDSRTTVPTSNVVTVPFR